MKSLSRKKILIGLFAAFLLAVCLWIIPVSQSKVVADEFVFENHVTHKWGNWEFNGDKAVGINPNWWNEFIVTDYYARKD